VHSEILSSIAGPVTRRNTSPAALAMPLTDDHGMMVAPTPARIACASFATDSISAIIA